LDAKENVMEIVSQTILTVIASATMAYDADFIGEHVTANVLGWTVAVSTLCLASTIVLQKKVLMNVIDKLQLMRRFVTRQPTSTILR
jgi:hypothetical protein